VEGRFIVYGVDVLGWMFGFGDGFEGAFLVHGGEEEGDVRGRRRMEAGSA
jgi:hypothetical protein